MLNPPRAKERDYLLSSHTITPRSWRKKGFFRGKGQKKKLNLCIKMQMTFFCVLQFNKLDKEAGNLF